MATDMAQYRSAPRDHIWISEAEYAGIGPWSLQTGATSRMQAWRCGLRFANAMDITPEPPHTFRANPAEPFVSALSSPTEVPVSERFVERFSPICQSCD
jgi:hypothetical protein